MSSNDRQIVDSDCIIIGGGITGLIIANILHRRQIAVTILNEGQVIGERLATRSIHGEGSIEGIFDYGTQYFTANSLQFQTWVDDWLKHGVVKEWCRGFGQIAETCYCGTNGMQSIAQYLAKNLDLRTNSQVTEVSYDKKWLVNTQSDRQYRGDMLVMTSPIPQSLSLLDTSLIALPLEIRFSLEEIKYQSCIAVLVLLKEPSNIPPPGGISLENDFLAWLADNHQKGISPHGYAVTLHATPQFSDEYWDSDRAEIAYKLITAATDYLNSAAIEYQVHRWRYSLPQTFYSEPCLTSLELPLVMAGDAFVAPTLEGAVRSGVAAGKVISQRFKVNS